MANIARLKAAGKRFDKRHPDMEQYRMSKLNFKEKIKRYREIEEDKK